jgi:cytochrome d ubiquinol oxidase subunit I
MEYVQRTTTHAPEYLGGVLVNGKVKGAIRIPDLDSLLVDFSADTRVTGLDSVPPADRPPAPSLLHLTFDAMVGIGFALLALGAWWGIAWWRRRRGPETRWFLRAVAVSGVASVVALECGWIVTEVGRQPWIVYQRLRTADAVTSAGGIWWSLIVVLVLYAGLAVAAALVLRTMARRWRERADDDADVPYGPPVAAP